MGFKVADRVKEIINAPGSGNIILSGIPAIGFQPFSNVLSSGDYTYYVLEQKQLWETGYGQYLNGQFSREFIFDSYNSGEVVNFNGIGTISITYPSERAVYTTQDNHYAVAGSGVIFDNDPSKTLNTQYEDLYWDSKKLAYDQDLVYVSGLAVNAEETLDIEYVSGVAVYASGQVDNLSNYSNITSSINAGINDNLLFIDSSSSDVNVYMPLATGNGGKQLKIKWIEGTNAVNILPSGNETIDGQNAVTMHMLYQSITLSSNNSSWFIT